VHCVGSGEGINTTNDKGETYLHFAAFNAEPQLVKWLIEKGADCNMQVTVMSSHHVLLFLLYLKSDAFSCTPQKSRSVAHAQNARGLPWANSRRSLCLCLCCAVGEKITQL